MYNCLAGQRQMFRHCTPQDGLLPGVTKASVGEGLNARFGVEAGREFRGRHLAGWYLQQVNKIDHFNTPAVQLLEW